MIQAKCARNQTVQVPLIIVPTLLRQEKLAHTNTAQSHHLFLTSIVTNALMETLKSSQQLKAHSYFNSTNQEETKPSQSMMHVYINLLFRTTFGNLAESLSDFLRLLMMT